MKTFISYYHENMSCHCHPEYDTEIRVVVAEDKSAAKDKIIAAFPNKPITDWSIEEIPNDKPGLFDEYGYKLD